MNRFTLASDVRELIRACLGDNCGFRLVIARGRPTEECDMIALWFGDQILDRLGDCEDSFCEVEQEMRLNIRLTRICFAPTGNIDIDWDAEEEAALCFYRDLELLECCLDDNPGWLQIKRDHGITSIARIKTVMSGESNIGGAVSARIELIIKGAQCCDEFS